MKHLDLKQIAEYVEANVGTFHKKRLESLENLKLKEILQRKNPYLFRAKNILTAQDLVKSILDAFLQSQEETMFGDFIEGVAIFVCKQINDAKKSTDLVGIDLEFERDDNYYVIEIKSGPNWGNSSQIKKMLDNFAAARAKLKDKKVVAINGCCYGRDNKPHKDEYIKLCGQRFWTFISGDENLYATIIEPFGHKAHEKNETFSIAYAKIINRFTFEFGKDFCDESGEIDWKKLIIFNSGILR
jgi:hypothetical protein